jgi:glyoxylase-like metal-dependent hydrolase (beta-lactamase superfamily II)
VMTAVPAPLLTYRVGDAELSYLPDGHILLQADRMYRTDLWDSSEHRELIDANGFLIMSMGSFLIQQDGANVLIDLGLGPRQLDVGALSGGLMQGQMVGGQLLDQLGHVDLGPADIDAVLITHLHDEHIGWTLDPASPEPALLFANARHCVSRREWAAVTDPDAPPSPVAPTADQIRLIGENLQLLDDVDEPMPGIRALLTAGHTPGHTSYILSSQHEQAVIIGDVAHSPVEFTSPELEFIGDADPIRAQQSRKSILHQLTQPNTIVAGVHFPNNVFARWEEASRTLQTTAPNLDQPQSR